MTHSKKETAERSLRFQRHRRVAKKAYDRIRPKLLTGAWDPDEVIDEIVRAIDYASTEDIDRLVHQFQLTSDVFSGNEAAEFIRKIRRGE